MEIKSESKNMSRCDIDDEIEHLCSQEVKNMSSGLEFKTIIVMNYFSPSTATSRSFEHFKCMICQVEILGRHPVVSHAKSQRHKEILKQYSVVKKNIIHESRLLIEAEQREKAEEKKQHKITSMKLKAVENELKDFKKMENEYNLSQQKIEQIQENQTKSKKEHLEIKAKYDKAYLNLGKINEDLRQEVLHLRNQLMNKENPEHIMAELNMLKIENEALKVEENKSKHVNEDMRQEILHLRNQLMNKENPEHIMAELNMLKIENEALKIEENKSKHVNENLKRTIEKLFHNSALFNIPLPPPAPPSASPPPPPPPSPSLHSPVMKRKKTYKDRMEEKFKQQKDQSVSSQNQFSLIQEEIKVKIPDEFPPDEELALGIALNVPATSMKPSFSTSNLKIKEEIKDESEIKMEITNSETLKKVT